jgi:hypothetical protein
MTNINILMISFITFSLIFINFSFAEDFNKACSNTLLFVELGTACLLIAAFFQTALVIMTHFN